MTAKLRVQRICYCTQCEKILPTKCEACKVHPDRKPRVVEIFDAPRVRATNDCGCVRIGCQRPGCFQAMWRHPRADGTLGLKNHFCSPECVRIVTAAAKTAKRITLVCSCGCARTVTRPASNMRAKHTYFSQLCHFKHRVALKSAARRVTVDERAVQAKVCESPVCRGAVTDHMRLTSGRYSCVRCKAQSKEASMRTAQ